MYLHFSMQNDEWCDDESLDLEDVYQLDHVQNVDDLAEALVVELAKFAIQHEASLADIQPEHIDDGDGNELEISSTGTDGAWIEEVAQLAWHVFDEMGSWEEPAPLYACIENQGWRWFDFDTIDNWTDTYHKEYDGDPESFAKEEMDASGDGVPDHMESFFDFDGYGESLLEGYGVVEWGGREFLFFQ